MLGAGDGPPSPATRFKRVNEAIPRSAGLLASEPGELRAYMT